MHFFFGLEGFWGVSLEGRISRLPEKTLLALSLNCSTKALPRRYHPTENWLISRCWTSVIARELELPS